MVNSEGATDKSGVAAVVAVGGHRSHVGIGIRRPAQIAQFSVGVTHDDDGTGLTAPREPRVPHGCAGGRDNAIGADDQAPSPIGLRSSGCSRPTRPADQSTAPNSHSVATTTVAVSTTPSACTHRPCLPNQPIALS